MSRPGCTRSVEEGGCLLGLPLPPPQLGQSYEGARCPRRAGVREVLDRGRQLRFRESPLAAPEVDRAVLCPAESEHVAAAVALGECGDPVAPLVCAPVVEHRNAGPDEEAAGPGTGDRNRGLALERRRGRLVEIAHAFVDLRGRNERGALESKTEHLEVGHVEAPPELRGGGTKFPGRRYVSAGVGKEPFVEGKPTVVGPRLELVE